MSGPSFGISYSFRWTTWAGPLVFLTYGQSYSWVNNLSQPLSAGTSIIGTIALATALLALVGTDLKYTRYLGVGWVLSLLVASSYIGVVFNAVRIGHSAWSPACIHGLAGTCNDNPAPINNPAQSFPIIETWGFQTGYYLFLAGIAVAFCALIFDMFYLHQRAARVQAEARKVPTIEWVCQNCGATVPAGGEFCRKCGTPVPI